MTSNPSGLEELSGAFDPESYIQSLGSIPDDRINLAHAALALAALSHEGVSLGRYIYHLQVIGDEVGARYAEIFGDSAKAQLEALSDILHGRYHYSGDRESYDDLQNASLIRVIDRAKGRAIVLSILYIHSARAQGWNIVGLDVSGHFLCRLEAGGQRIIFDPFEDGRIVEAQDMREIVKRVFGAQAELSSEYYEPVGNRGILVRLQNIIKFRQIEAEDYQGALETVQRMRQIDPQEYRLLLDEGVLLARTGEPRGAIDSLVAYIEKAPNSRDRMEAELLLQQLNDALN